MWTLGQCFTQRGSKLWWYDLAFEKLLKLWWRIFDHTPFWSLKFRQKLEVISDLWKRYSPCGPPVASQVSLSHYLTVLNISNSRPRDNIEKGSKLFRITSKNSVALFRWKRKRLPWARRSNSLPWHWSWTLYDKDEDYISHVFLSCTLNIEWWKYRRILCILHMFSFTHINAEDRALAPPPS